MIINVNYQKRRNQPLFQCLEDLSPMLLSKAQNYIPIYSRFFNLNETNYNNVNLNHKWFITDVKEVIDEQSNVFFCRLKNTISQKTKDKDVFFKLAPLLDPYKYLIGKYDVTDINLFNLPDMRTDDKTCNPKLVDVNNCAYVDGFFLFLTSSLIHNNNFLHGVDYYGSFLGIKNKYKLNIFDDLEYLVNSEFFNKNKGVLFHVDDYDCNNFFEGDKLKLVPLKIEHNLSNKSNMSIKSINETLFENIFHENTDHINLDELKEMDIDLIDITHSNEMIEGNHSTTLRTDSGSDCSSRTSHTSTENNNENNYECTNCDGSEGDGDNENVEEESCGEEVIGKEEETHDEASDEEENDEEESEEEESEEEERVEATIPKFPIQIICMENCEDTFDSLIMKNELKPEEWISAFMQIIMILITYQKVFAFTHNDLHTNNVMFNTTTKKYIYYCYNNTHYKVPTFGRIFKIIDFGRSIYKFEGKTFCSDSFKTGNDAATQYNTEPYFNEKKPRLEPNFSFDICRLACSIFDYIIEDVEDIRDIEKCDQIQRLVFEWCLDDNGINMLYKNNGADRYPDFKLYKMIARCVHNHTPQAQLFRPEFKAFAVSRDVSCADMIDIDKMRSCC